MNKFLVISFLCFGTVLFGQDDLYDHGLDQNKWEDIREGIRYEGRDNGPGREWTYENKDEFNKEREKYESESGSGSGSGSGRGDGASRRLERSKYRKSSPPPRVNRNIEFPNLSGLGFFGYLIIGVFAIGLIFLIYYLFVNVQTKGKKINAAPIVFDEVNPTEIPLTELQRLLQEAISKNNFRGAVRIYFIFIVRDLAAKKWIKWEKEKTNFQYLREMSGKNEFEDFNTSVNYFEIIWYGKREIDAEMFERVKPSFTLFLDKLGVK